MNRSSPKVVAEAAFSRDMVETLLRYFDQYERDGIVRVEVSTHGLWLRPPGVPMRHFLGLAEGAPFDLLHHPFRKPH